MSASTAIYARPGTPQQGVSDKLLRYNLAAFIDLLGQSTPLRRLTDLSFNSEAMQATTELLRETVGRVRAFRYAFEQFFKAYTENAGVLEQLSQPQAAMARPLRHSMIRVRGFSDSVVIDVSLAGDNENCTAMNGVYGVIVAIAGIFPEMMAAGVPLRAGIDIGLGIDVVDGELYGPALERAYVLESKVAQWPRIAVGGELTSYLDQLAHSPTRTISDKLASELAAGCLALIKNDVDGTPIVDYLGSGMTAIGVVARPEAVQRMREFADRMMGEHAADERLRERWCRVVDYIQARSRPV